MEIMKCSVLVVDRLCGLELFRVNIEEPTSDGPPPELWECAMSPRTHHVSTEEERKLRADDEDGLVPVDSTDCSWRITRTRYHNDNMLVCGGVTGDADFGKSRMKMINR